MQKKNWLLIGTIIFFLTITLLALPTNSAPAKENRACCQKSAPECEEKPINPLEVLPGSLSHQFIMLLSPSF